MISLCAVTVALDDENCNNEIFEQVFIESVTKKLPLVSEILICKINAKNDFINEWNNGGKKIIKFGYKNNFFHDRPPYELVYPSDFPELLNNLKNAEETLKKQNLPEGQREIITKSFNDYLRSKKDLEITAERNKNEKINAVFTYKVLFLGHPLGIKYAIEKASNDWVMLCDPDIFFYTAVDEYYYKLVQKYNLDYIGACPHLSYLYSTKYFPNILCMLTKKSSLPTDEFIKSKTIVQDAICGQGKVRYDDYPREPEYLDGEYLVGTKINSIAPKFPNPDGIFDTGVYLWLWAQEHNQNWLAFQPFDIHMYTSQIYRTNLKIKDKLTIQKLFYHATGGSRHLYIDDFLKEYEKEHN